MGFKKLVNDIKVEKRRKLIAIYCRVSTEEQSENGYSIDEQERLLEEWCKKMGYVIYKCYSDRGISGKNIKDRPALKELLSDAKAGKFDMVISWKINRVSRKLEDVLKIVNLLEKNNITFKSYSEPFETDTPAGRMQFQMMALIGEFERGTIAQNVKMGMIAKAKSGNWCGGRVLGYDLVPNNSPEEEKKGKNKLKINEKEAEIVRFIFNEYSKGKGYKAITNQINKLGYKTKKGNDFSVGSIRDILTNPVYIGEIRYNVRQNWSEKRRRNINPNPIRVKGKHEAIIDRELWDKVQLILESKKGKPSRIYDGEYPLTGILRCPKCGAGMVISRTTNTLADGSKKRIAYYCCGNWKNKGTSVCNSNTIRVDKVKPAKRLLGDIDKELEKLDKRKRKIFEAYEDDILTKAEFQIRKDELNEKIRILEEEKKPLLNTISEDVSEEIPYEFIKDILMNFSKILNSSVSREQQKKLLHMIISEITMNESREIESIKLNINDKLVEYLVKEGGVPIKGIPSSFMLINVGLKVLNLDVVI